MKKEENNPSLCVCVCLITRQTVAATFTDASDQMSGNILVVDPPGGQMENYISRGTLAESKAQTSKENIYIYMYKLRVEGLDTYN